MRGRKWLFAQTGITDETFDLDESIACEVIWHNYMKLLKLEQGPGHRYENKCKVSSIYIDGSVLIGSDTVLMDNGHGAHRSGPIDGILGLLIVLDRKLSDQCNPNFQDVLGKVTGNCGSKADLHVRNNMLNRFHVLIREKIIVKSVLRRVGYPLIDTSHFLKRIDSSLNKGLQNIDRCTL